MYLFERVRKIAKYFTGSDKALAEKLGFKQQTFCGYFNEKRQDNLWPVLPKILALFPTIQRDWLYFGEGAMLKDSPSEGETPYTEVSVVEPGPLDDRMGQLERKNTELTEKLFAAKDELLEAKNELLASKDKIIALHEENKRLVESVSAVMTPTETRRDNPQHATSDRPASGATDCGV